MERAASVGTDNIQRAAEELRAFLKRSEKLFVLTGAGCSTASGIPGYRDEKGQWKHKPPMQYQQFMGDLSLRQRYWARSFAGWPRFNAARPNAAHVGLVQLEQCGQLRGLVTQNVDRLHQKAGSQHVMDLHGRLDRVVCMACGQYEPRSAFQQRLLDENEQFFGQAAVRVSSAPDGDAALTETDFSAVRIPECSECNGLLKPDVVFYGETVPKERVERAYRWVQTSDAVLVIGSSLMVFSGSRFIKRARDLTLPIALLNQGISRADSYATHCWRVDAGSLLSAVV